MNRAIFLDRDGILIRDVSYPHKLEDLHINMDLIPYLKWAKSLGFLIIIVTNQAGIAKGKFTLEQYKKFQEKLETELESLGVKIDRTYFCPYHKDGVVELYTKESNYRKPKPGMFLDATTEFNIDIKKSFMIGDKFSDIIELDGLKCYILSSQYTGHELGTYPDFESIFREIKKNV